MTDLTDAALELAAQDYPVFPCNTDKSPRTVGGFKAATTDAEKIESWNWLDAMIGVAIPDGLVIIDIDPRNGGLATIDTLWMMYGSFPPTHTVGTRSDGFHYYFTVPEDVTLRSTLGPGIDVKRAGKGYVIAPPSEGYRYINDAPVAPIPNWLLDELTVTPTDKALSEAHAPKFMVFEKGTAYGLRALELTLDRLSKAANGERNAELNKAAFGLGQLVAGGELDEEHAVESLLQAALETGLKKSEIPATAKSGFEAGLEDPRQAPPRDEHGSSGDAAPQSGSAVAGTEEPAPFKWVDWTIDEPAPPFYLYPILPENAYVIVYGATEAAKSMTMVGILAEGSRKGLRSSIYSLENPPVTDRDRLRRWAPDPANLRLTNEPLDLFSVAHVDALVDRETEFGTQVVMIDTYSHAFNSHSEDGNAKAIAFARRVRYVMAQVGCSFIVVDHTGFQGDEPRDASAKRQAVDVAIHMEKNGDWVHGQAAKFTMRNRKAARFANPFYFGGEIHDVDHGKGLDLRWAGSKPEWRL